MSGPDLLAILPTAVVIAWACVLLLVDVFVVRGRKAITALVAAAGLGASAAAVLPGLGGSWTSFDGMIHVDSFAHFLTFVFLGAGAAGIALAHDYLKRMGMERGEYYPLILFSTAGMILMAHAGDLIIVFLALELLSIPLYVLAGLARPRFESEEAALKYFILGSFSSSFVVYGIALAYGATETSRLTDILEAWQSGAANTQLLLAGSELILVGLAFKVAVVPFHMWTPDVYHGSPSPVVAFMSVGAKAGGFAGLLRVLMTAFPGLAGNWAPAAALLAALTMVWGNVAAIGQSNVKRMLAYSSIAHAGYILMALPAAAQDRVAPDAISALLFYLLAYAITNLGAWGIVLALEQEEGRGLNLEDYSGLLSRRPGLAVAMAIFMLSLTGVPPTAGFLAKFYLFRSVIDAGYLWLALVGVVTSLVSAYYYLRLVVMMTMQPGKPETRSEAWLNATIGVAAMATVLLGIVPGPLMTLATQSQLMNVFP